ncbi:hypothetical protein [Micromonospora craniellae]|nr:hypothetical protein [Micromonospora craniellae]QOC93329.1 hypothetical protein ID554_06550 [Micromonospora craniellae]
MSPATSAMAEVPGLLDSFIGHQIIKRIGEPEDLLRGLYGDLNEVFAP